MRYFAYGSNLWREQMERRCPGHRLIGPGSLKGYRWIITIRGYASVVVSPEDEVPGLVYELLEPDELNLDWHEGVHRGDYRKELLPVEMEDGTVQCLVYIDEVTEEGEPWEEYVERLRKGFADAGLPDSCLRR